jgi:hypothetical protein
MASFTVLLSVISLRQSSGDADLDTPVLNSSNAEQYELDASNPAWTHVRCEERAHDLTPASPCLAAARERRRDIALERTKQSMIMI